MHAFILSIGESNSETGLICRLCKRKLKDHTADAVCDCCEYVGPCEIKFGNMLMCPSCIEKEEKSSKENMSPENQQTRVDAMNHSMKERIIESQKIDSQVQIRTDIFNAQTVSIHELKESILADTSIVNKNYRLAELLTERLNGFKKAIFELNQEMVDRNSEQRAVQTYLNELSNKLRADEREKIKLEDINYQPNPVKITKPRTGSTIKKFDKTEIRKYSIQLNTWAIEHSKPTVPESVLQMVCIAKNMTPAQAYEQLIKGMS